MLIKNIGAWKEREKEIIFYLSSTAFCTHSKVQLLLELHLMNRSAQALEYRGGYHTFFVKEVAHLSLQTLKQVTFFLEKEKNRAIQLFEKHLRK